MYNELFRLTFLVDVVIVDFADDMTAAIYGASIEEVELTAAQSTVVMEEWTSSSKRQLVYHETKPEVGAESGD